MSRAPGVQGTGCPGHRVSRARGENQIRPGWTGSRPGSANLVPGRTESPTPWAHQAGLRVPSRGFRLLSVSRQAR